MRDIDMLKYFMNEADDKTVKRSMKVLLDGLEKIISFDEETKEAYEIEEVLEKVEEELRINI